MVNLYEILQKIGFDWQVALANLFNFLLILFLLKKFAFKPVGKMIKDRQDKISEGLQKAEEAEIRLKEVDAIAKKHLQKADAESLELIKSAKLRAQKLEESLVKRAEEHQKELMAQIELNHQRQEEEMRNSIFAEALGLVKKAVVKTVELDPKKIDEALIKKAVAEVKSI